MGSFLFNRNTTQWKATLEGWKNNPDSGIMKVLQSSFDGLEQREGEIFLHVACFFEGEREDGLCEANSYLPNFQPHYLVDVNLSDSSLEKLWIRIQYLPHLKRMNLSNSKNLRMTPRFDGMQNLERLDFIGCTNLLEVHQSIGLLTKLVFLSLQNCRSLVNLGFNNETTLNSLRVLLLLGCIKLENFPDLTGALILEYLDMDQCKCLTMIHESIGTLEKLRFLSLRDCTSLVRIPDCLNGMTSLVTLDLRDCLNFTNLPINSPPISMIHLDLSFCNISEVPDAIGELRCLERLNLQGNNFTTIPSTIKGLSNLSYFSGRIF